MQYSINCALELQRQQQLLGLHKLQMVAALFCIGAKHFAPM
jgi:hypothetical protein